MSALGLIPRLFRTRRTSFVGIIEPENGLPRRSLSSRSKIVQRRSIPSVQKTQSQCICGVDTFSRNFSMLDVFRRKKESKDSEIVKEEGDEELPSAVRTFLIEDETPELTEEEVEAKRNKSGLSPHHRRLVHGEMPYSEAILWFHNTVAYKRRMFGRYGEESGVNPGIMWPTKEELEKKIEYEQICNPLTIQEMVKQKQELRAAQKREFEEREKEIASRIALLDKFKEELHSKQRAKDEELNAAKERRESLMEEVKRHFGYTVDSRDERFKELLEKKEKEQRKAMKEARKIEKQQRILDKLDTKETSKSSSSAVKEKPKTDADDAD